MGCDRSWVAFILTVITVLALVPSAAQPLAGMHSVVTSVTSLAVSADGRNVVVATKDGVIYYFDRATSKEMWKYTIWRRINAVSISYDGSYVVAGGDNGFVYLFDRDFSGNSYVWRRALGGSILSLAISIEGNYIVAGCYDHGVCFVDRTSSDVLWVYKAEDRVRAIDVSGDGCFVAAGSDDGCLYLFDRGHTGHTFLSRFKTEGPIISTSISEDGSSLIAGSLDGYIYYQNRRMTPDTYTWRHKTGPQVTSVTLSSDGGYASGGDSKGHIYFFDSEYSGNTYRWMYSIGAGATMVSLSEDGGLLAAGCERGVYLFDRAFHNNSYLWFYPTDSRITSVGLSADGYSVAAGDEKGYLYLFWPSIVPEVKTEPRTEEKPTGPLTTAIPPSTLAVTSAKGEAARRLSAYWYVAIVVLLAAAGVGILRIRRKVKERFITRYPIGYGVLDRLSDGGVPAGYSLLLLSPPCDPKDEIIIGYLKEGLKGGGTCVYVADTADRVAPLLEDPHLYVVACNPRAAEIVPSSPNVATVRGAENVTELNIALANLMGRLPSGVLPPPRICLDVIDDVLLHRKGVTTRSWLQELTPRLRKWGIILALANPRMHPREDLNAILSVFEGQVDIVEERKKMKISVSRMHGLPHSRERVTI